MKEKIYSAIAAIDKKGYASLEEYGSILNATSLDGLASELHKITSAIGFQHYLYGSHVKMPNGDVFQYIFNGYPGKWMEKYLSSGYIHLDPVVDYCCTSNKSMPLLWQDNIFDTPQRKEFMEDARAHGLSSGVSIPVSATNEVAVFSVANPIDNVDAHEHSAHKAGAMYVISSYLHEAIRSLVYSQEMGEAKSPNLTPKEIECLRWWGSGKTVDEIGIILAMSSRTVRFHLDNAKKKLDANTKSQAIARASRLGLISA
jgi:LuxR family transcriptional activator of bioluminescence operon